MTARKKSHKDLPAAPRARKTRSRQRQRLIDACISALHIHGPSRTTVEKVVAIAKMSPGIVRFYFDSKAAMLVASLQFLAAEFEEQLLLPVAQLKATPVAALESLIGLYLDPDIASPRKVSVWYAYWGEASSRQEYYDICGQKDERFTALIRELIGSLIVETGQPHLDPDGIALGLIGALEILWQDFAFREECDIDRVVAKKRCRAYLRSIFPGQFAETLRPPIVTGSVAQTLRLSGWAYANPRLHALERERLFLPAWAVVGHESQLRQAGDYLTADTGAERVLVVRDADGVLRALRNSCPQSPHRLVAGRSGCVDGEILCRLHGLTFTLDGRSTNGVGGASLTPLDVCAVTGLLLARRPLHPAPALALPGPEAWFDIPPARTLRVLGSVEESPVAADWKVIVEQWLGTAGPLRAPQPGLASPEYLVWQTTLDQSSWSARRYAGLLADASHTPWIRHFIMPNQLIESRPDGLAIVQVLPVAAGRSILRRLDFTQLASPQRAHAARYAAHRLSPLSGGVLLQTAESTQQGMVQFGYETPRRRGIDGVAWFHQRVAQSLPAAAQPRAPSDALSL